MTRNVISVGPDETVLKAARLDPSKPHQRAARDQNKDGELIEHRDRRRFSRAAVNSARNAVGRNGSNSSSGPGRLADEYVHASGRKVDEIMTTDPVSAAEGQLARKSGRGHGAPPRETSSGGGRKAAAGWSASSAAPI